MDIIFDQSVFDSARLLAFKSDCTNLKFFIVPLFRNLPRYIKDGKFSFSEMTENSNEIDMLKTILYQAIETQLTLCKNANEKEYLEQILLNK